ncbi:uncharacterized protein [Blastocystis hominis]|uniref:Uncharacterized protein n=1 Tax=Blastocystis hominis TaxID=12968 RepID=D8M668_BLAHO|nr:uncharacterized protein [Blastocystis hominis]CBK23777.2 unnamed protein product [Blastocystis hominis]|eukprot:XP_012897825.1 uncharacterized protein [Blastocystis hominis]
MKIMKRKMNRNKEKKKKKKKKEKKKRKSRPKNMKNSQVVIRRITVNMEMKKRMRTTNQTLLWSNKLIKRQFCTQQSVYNRQMHTKQFL